MIKIKITSIKLILLVSLFITVANNQTFFAKATDRLDLFSFQGAVYVLSIYTIVFIALVFIHLIFGTKFLLKPLMIFLLIVSAGFSYFTQELGVVFDDDMIRNLFETIKDNNQQEATELLSFPLIKHVIIYG
ncbi:MAG: phosphoethanolamine transferase domain-containing protein, partial [Cocleimonas sp.]